MKTIGARFEGEIHYSPARSPEFCGVAVGLHLEFANGVNRRFDGVGLVTVDGGVVGVVVKSVKQVAVVNGADSARAEPPCPAASAAVFAGCTAALSGRRRGAL